MTFTNCKRPQSLISVITIFVLFLMKQRLLRNRNPKLDLVKARLLEIMKLMLIEWSDWLFLVLDIRFIVVHAQLPDLIQVCEVSYSMWTVSLSPGLNSFRHQHAWYSPPPRRRVVRPLLWNHSLAHFTKRQLFRVRSHWALAMLFALAGIARNGYSTHSLGKFSTHFCIAYGNAIVKSSVWTELNSWSLPPTNEVWGKVIFSQACVRHSVHRKVSVWCHFLSDCLVPYSLWGSLSLAPNSFQGVSVQGRGLCPGQGVSVQGFSVWRIFI